MLVKNVLGKSLDLTNGIISAIRGDWVMAGLSIGSMIPIAGDIAGKGGKAAIKYGDNVVDAIKGAGKVADNVVDAGKIKGYTKHGLNQAIGRDGGLGVSPKSILDAVNNPIKVISQIDSLGNKIKYVGKDAVVVLNKLGEIITTYAKSSLGIRGVKP